MDQRKVGRPVKGPAEVGKQGLVRKAREELRQRRFDVFQRKELASACEVTPALITYYFRSSDDIFENIVASVIEKYYNEVIMITRSNLSRSERYKNVVNLLIFAFRRDANIFETFKYALAMNLCKRPDYISLLKEELKLISQECFSIDILDLCDRDVMHGAVWGMCEAAAKYGDGARSSVDNFDSPLRTGGLADTQLCRHDP